MKRKTKFIIAGAVVLVLAFASIGTYYLMNRKSQEEKLSASLKSMGQEFYESFYFEHVSTSLSESEMTSFFDQFVEIGIKVNLESLGTYNNAANADIAATFVNDETGNACNAVNTRAIIYPVAPYTNTSYTIEVELDCGFGSTAE